VKGRVGKEGQWWRRGFDFRVKGVGWEVREK
jgi:hypothetical protein